MYPTVTLEWWKDGAWREIGWPATNADSYNDLCNHAEALARHDPDGHYRLVQASHLRDGPPGVIRAWGPS